MRLVYKNVFKLVNGVLVKNTVNKIEYVDDAGKKRVKTNPTYEDFKKVEMYPVRYVGEEIRRMFRDKKIATEIKLVDNSYFEVRYTVVDTSEE